MPAKAKTATELAATIGAGIVARAKQGSVAGPWGAVAGGAVGAVESVTANAEELNKSTVGKQVVNVINPLSGADSVGEVALNMLAPWRHWLTTEDDPVGQTVESAELAAKRAKATRDAQLAKEAADFAKTQAYLAKNPTAVVDAMNSGFSGLAKFELAEREKQRLAAELAALRARPPSLWHELVEAFKDVWEGR